MTHPRFLKSFIRASVSFLISGSFEVPDDLQYLVLWESEPQHNNTIAVSKL